MSSIGFVNSMLDGTNHMYQVMLNQFDWWKKVQGTKCQVIRTKESSKYKSVFGPITNSTLPDDSDAERFNYVVLINMNDMKKLYDLSIDPMTFYDNKDILKLGDILSFSRGTRQYKWKVTDIMTFSETADTLYQYTITGLFETKSTK